MQIAGIGGAGLGAGGALGGIGSAGPGTGASSAVESLGTAALDASAISSLNSLAETLQGHSIGEILLAMMIMNAMSKNEEENNGGGALSVLAGLAMANQMQQFSEMFNPIFSGGGDIASGAILGGSLDLLA